MNLWEIVKINGRSQCHYVYFLCCEADAPGAVFVKIGMSQNPLRRVRDIANSCAVQPLSFGFVGCGCRAETHRMELALHAIFALWRQRGEWYRFEAKDKNTFHVLRKETFEKYNTFNWPMKFQMIDVNEVLANRNRQGHKTSRRYAKRVSHYKKLHAVGNNDISASRMPMASAPRANPSQLSATA